MSSFTLCKCTVTYMGGSTGPGISRLIKVKHNDKNFIVDNSLQISVRKQSDRELRYPVEIPLNMSEDAIKDFESYMKSYDVLERAKAEFEKAKNMFKTTVGGETLLNAMIPQKSPLPVDQVIAKDDVEELKKVVSSILGDNKIIETECSVKGYNCGLIVMKLEKPIIQTTVEDITYKDYSWSKYFYETYYDTSYDDTTKTLVFKKKGGSMYAPFYYADFLELQARD